MGSGSSSGSHRHELNGQLPPTSTKHSRAHVNPHLTKQFLIRNPSPLKQRDMGNQQNGGCSYEPIGLNDAKSSRFGGFLKPSQSLFLTDLGTKLSSATSIRRSKSRESGLATSVPSTMRTSKSAYSAAATPASDLSLDTGCNTATGIHKTKEKWVISRHTH